ncbi:hypothetical protein Dsin_008552 [Dipteronia sinensis]|uniref:RNase H type-1 domain-containing protein n=1 Tax=Dipteronia sinensis TaxID=43782 RepID=A0AAE0EB99_9ROSI|nr:hypothetical protein Dsin_008552 [Dipteronia sinensis]
MLEGRKLVWVLLVRESTGFVHACSSQVVSATFNAQIAEALAVFRAIHFFRDCGLFPCVLESDAEVVIKWIVEGSHLDSAGGVILSDISYLIEEIGGLSIGFAPRQANRVAHVLAKQALCAFNDFFWMEDLSSLCCCCGPG